MINVKEGLLSLLLAISFGLTGLAGLVANAAESAPEARRRSRTPDADVLVLSLVRNGAAVAAGKGEVTPQYGGRRLMVSTVYGGVLIKFAVEGGEVREMQLDLEPEVLFHIYADKFEVSPNEKAPGLTLEDISMFLPLALAEALASVAGGDETDLHAATEFLLGKDWEIAVTNEASLNAFSEKHQPKKRARGRFHFEQKMIAKIAMQSAGYVFNLDRDGYVTLEAEYNFNPKAKKEGFLFMLSFKF